MPIEGNVTTIDNDVTGPIIRVHGIAANLDGDSIQGAMCGCLDFIQAITFSIVVYGKNFRPGTDITDDGYITFPENR